MPESSLLHRTTYHKHDGQSSKESKCIGLVLLQILCTLENDELCLSQQAKDIALSIRNQEIQCGTVFIRPIEQNGATCVSITVGKMKWKKQFATLLVQSLGKNGSSTLHVLCTCHLIHESNVCTHKMWLSSKFELELKLKSITSRYVAPCHSEVADGKWEVLRIPRIDGDEYGIYLAFSRRHMKCMWISNATVSMDFRPKHLRQSLKDRLD